MSAKKMGLGRGLNTLIPKAPIVDEEDVEQVKKKVSRSSKTKKKEETKKFLRWCIAAAVYERRLIRMQTEALSC